MAIVMVLSAFWFAAPLMLIGIAGIAAPIIAHLMNRRTRRRITFPTIRLLVESASSQSRLYRIRRWLLLALRCLAIFFIAAAFAQPGCSSRSDAVMGDSDSLAVVYVLDVSASVGRQSTDGDLLDRMRSTVLRSLDELKPGRDRVNVVIADAKPRAMFPPTDSDETLITNLDAVRTEMSSLTITPDRADIRNALALAGQLLDQADGRRRIVVVSDMQRRNWDNVPGSADDSLGFPSGTALAVLPLVDEVRENLALHSPRSNPAHPVTNRSVNLSVRISNFTRSQRDVPVTMLVDGQPAGTETIRLEAGEAREHGFPFTFRNADLHRVEFSIPSDALAIDNRCFLTVDVTSRLPIFVVGDDNPDELGGSTYFLMRALAPRGDDRDLIQVNHITSADVAAANLSGAAAVFISDVEPLAEKAINGLLTYMNSGGGIIWFAGGNSVEHNLRRMIEQGGESTVPLKLGVRQDIGSVNEHAMIGEGVWAAPALAEFDPQSQALLQRIRFSVIHDVEAIGQGAKVLLTFTGDRPALALQNVGEGRFVLANFSPSLEAGDLGKYGSFPALVHSLRQFVQPRRDARLFATVGGPVHAKVALPVADQVGTVTLRGPDDQLRTPSLSRDGQQLLIDWPRTRLPGFYTVSRNGEKLTDIAVNVDSRESDLTPMDAVTLQKSLASNGVSAEVSGSDALDSPSPLRGRPIWHWFVVAAMLMIGCELALLAVWNR